MARDHHYYVYILASRIGGTLYTGVTNNLIRRVWEHKQGDVPGFTKKHNIKMLVYFETHTDIETAITREKQIKKWNRDWRKSLIEQHNPDWHDLYLGLTQ